MNKKLNEILRPEGTHKQTDEAKPVVSGGVDREVFPGYMTDGDFPQSKVYPISSWKRPADYVPGRCGNAWVRVSLVYWNQAKLEEGKLLICPVGKNRNEKRLESLLSLAYRVEDTLVHGKKAVEELKGLFRQFVG